jgi:TonB family protein
MRFARILIIGSLSFGIPGMLHAQSNRGLEIRETPGPLEQQAKPVTKETPLPRFKGSSREPEYPWELRRIGARSGLILQVTVDKSGRIVEARRAQGPLIQAAIGSPNDSAARRAAADAVLRSTSQALKDIRFEDPPDGPSTFQVSFAFVAGNSRVALADPSEVLPAEAQPAPWAAALGALPTGQVSMPKQKKYVKPVYSKAALDARVQGTVQLEVVIGPDGRVADARVLKSIPLLDQSAIEATLQARYEPVAVFGNPVSVVSIVNHTYSFKTKSE